MIEIKNLYFSYSGSDKFALKDISFTVKKGSYVAILGHNGSGKSTLSKLLMGVFTPDSGCIEIEVNEDNQSKEKVDKKIGIVFQNPDNQFIGSTVEDDIAFGLENKMMSREDMRNKILEIAKKVNMEKYLDWEPQNLSGGQKQKVAIASVLALDPEVIILDEVTSMLDPRGKKSILNLINDIKNYGEKTLISITHDMDEAIMADWIVVLLEGKIFVQGYPRDILSNSKIIKKAKLDKPFIYKLSELISDIEPTYDYDVLLKRITEICK